MVRSDDPRPFLELLDEEVELDATGYPLPDYSGVYVGRHAAEAFFRRFWTTWESYEVEVVEAIEAGENTVVVCLNERMLPRGSSVPIEHRNFQIWTFSEGKLRRWRVFRTETQALEAAGLSGRDAPPHSDG